MATFYTLSEARANRIARNLLAQVKSDVHAVTYDSILEALRAEDLSSPRTFVSRLLVFCLNEGSVEYARVARIIAICAIDTANDLSQERSALIHGLRPFIESVTGEN
jgi:hypothetical protein